MKWLKELFKAILVGVHQMHIYLMDNNESNLLLHNNCIECNDCRIMFERASITRKAIVIKR